MRREKVEIQSLQLTTPNTLLINDIILVVVLLNAILHGRTNEEREIKWHVY